jgi:hypothetical protein
VPREPREDRPATPPTGRASITEVGRRRAIDESSPVSPTAPSAAPARPTDTTTVEAPAGSRWHVPGARRWQLMAALVGVLAVFITCGAFSYRLVQDELNGRDAQANNEPELPATVTRDISSQEVDPEPLTVDEVFPDEELVAKPDEPPYTVLETEDTEDCGVAAADEMAALFEDLGCSQVVRATLRSPTEDYLITGGIVNLATEADAEQAYDQIKSLIEDGTGRFVGLLAGDGTESIVLSETVAIWDFRGHYLMYTLIARADGEEFRDADNRYADLIGWDIIEVHLRGTVLEQRATQPNPALAPATGTPAPTETTAPPAEEG